MKQRARERRVRQLSNESLRALAWSPDGQRLLLGGNGLQVVTVDGRVVWDNHQRGAVQMVAAVGWSPDGTRFFTGHADNGVHIWDASSIDSLTGLQQSASYFGHRSPILSAAWSPDGRLIASGSQDQTLRIWAAERAEELASMGPGAGTVGAVAFSPDGKLLASASGGRGSGGAFLWDATDLLDVVPDRARDSALVEWATKQAATVGRRPRTAALPAPPLWVPRFADADGPGALGTICRGEEFRGATAVALTGDGKNLYTGHLDGYMRLWDLDTGEVQTGWKAHDNDVQEIALAPDGRHLASVTVNGSCRIWDLHGDQVVVECRGHIESANAVAWSPDGQRIATGSADRTMRIWDAATGRPTAVYNHDSYIYGVAWSPDGARVASASDDSTVRIWNAVTGNGEVMRLRNPHDGGFDTVAWSPSGRLIATGGRRDHNYSRAGGASPRAATVCVWDAETGRLISTCEGHGEAIPRVAFSPDSTLLASGSFDQTVRIWNPATGSELRRFTFAEAYAWRLAWSRDGAYLVSAHGNEGVVRFWDTRDLLPPRRAAGSIAPGRVPAELASIPAAAVALHRVGIHCPLSLVRQLLALTGGLPSAESLADLARHPGVRRLTALRWPERARIGLAALLLREVPAYDWRPPAEARPEELRMALVHALGGEATDHQAPAPPAALLSRAADEIDDRIVTLLVALGADAVAADPALPLRLLHECAVLPQLSPGQLRLLERHVTPGDSGVAQGSGTGTERSGIAPRGPITALLPSQLAYERALLRFKHANGGLLYRARTGREPPHARPIVLVLDVSPACFGPIESVTRPAAYLIAASLRRRNVPLVLIAAGGSHRVHQIKEAADVIKLFTLRSLSTVNVAETLRAASTFAGSLRGASPDPVVVLLTHVFWGAEQLAATAPAHLRALFVQYPGRAYRPGWANRCERWETVGPQQHAELPRVLGRLIA